MRDSVWVWSGEAAILLGTIAFVALLAPILAFQYRRYGQFPLRRLVGAAGLSIYLTALITYTWLPLPTSRVASCPGAGGPQLKPFAFIDDIGAAHIGDGIHGAFSSFVVLQVVFNVILFVPWGIIARRYLGRSTIWAILTGFAISLLIESAQGTGLFSIYPCPYRLADVDDLITNTSGAFIGAIIAPIVLWWMPVPAAAQRGRMRPRTVTVWRRWAAMAIEGWLWFVISIAIVVAARALVVVVQGRLGNAWIEYTELFALVFGWLLVFAVPGVLGAGSLGMRAIWLQPRRRDGRVARWLIGLLRASAISVPWMVVISLDIRALAPLGWAWIALAILSVPFTRGRRGLSGFLSLTELADARGEPAHAQL